MDRIRSKGDDGKTGYRRNPHHVELILEKLAAGETIEQIPGAHLHFTREAILAALAFARDALQADVIYPLCFCGDRARHVSYTSCQRIDRWGAMASTYGIH